MKKMSRRKKKAIFSKDLEDMTLFEVFYTIPVGKEGENLLSIVNPQRLLDSFDVKPFSRSKMYALFNKPLTDSERLLISAQLKEIGERVLMAAQIIENQLIER